MNALVPQYHAQLPAFLRRADLFEATDKAIAGIGGGMPPYLSIKASKFRTVVDGEEAMVNQLHLDVIVLAGNEHVSKTYYQDAYDPAAGAATPPTCFSDNGTAPSVQAMTPQAATCAGCPHNVWGSKITPQGSHIKECSDSKRLAVVLANDTPLVVNGAAAVAKGLSQVFLLRVPAASMRNWRDYAKEIRARGAPIIGCVTRVTFDPETAYPALLFSAHAFINEHTYAVLEKHLATPAIAEATGSEDRPLAAAPATGGAAPSLPAPAAAAAPGPTPPAAAVSPPPAASSVAPAVVTGGTRTRGRPRAEPAQPGPAAPPTTAVTGAFLGNGGAIQPAAAADASLDALLARALG